MRDIIKYYLIILLVIISTKSNNCPSDQPHYDATSGCGKCYVETPYYTPINNMCTKECPDDYPYYNETYLICYKCPNETIFYINNTCLKECPEDKPLYDENYICSSCSKEKGGEFYDSELNECVEECPNNIPYYDENYKVCKGECIGEKNYHSQNGYICKTNCGSKELEFNYICYNSCPDNTKKSSNEKYCECIYKYNKINIGNNKTKINCLEINQNCPENYPYYNETTRECSSNKCENFTKIISTYPENYICVNNCEKNEFQYQDEKGNFCTENCPSKFPYHNKNELKCISNCENYFIDEINKICYDICPYGGLSLLNESEEAKIKNIKGECVMSFTCPVTYQYYYAEKKLCLDDCNKINEFNFSKPIIKNLFYQDEESQKCIAGCGENKFVDYESQKCVSECEENKWKYENICFNMSCDEIKNLYELDKIFILNETKECLKNCGKYYSMKNISDDNYCYISCPDGFYQDDDLLKCDKNCPIEENSKNIFIKKSINKCIENCEIPSNNELKDNEGFLENETSKICLNECPENKPYINYGENICYEKNDLKLKKLQIQYTNEFIDNCPKNYYKFNKMCYYGSCPINTEYNETIKECQCLYKYYNNNDLIICLGSSDKCPEKFKYYLDKECFSTPCETEYLKKTSNSPENYQCLTSCEENDYISTYEISDEIKKLCLRRCPNEQKYHIDNEKNCLEKCNETEYFTDTNNYLCLKECENLNLLNENGNETTFLKGKCITDNSCPLLYPYFYSDTKTCLSNCENTNNYLFLSNTKTYLNSGKKECVLQCPKYIDIAENECVDECDQNKFLDNITCINSCPEKYIYETKKCINNCTNYYFISESDKICYENCPENYYEDEDLHQCLLKCENNKYKSETTNKCVNCSDGFIYEETCYNKCPDEALYYYINDNKCFSNGCNSPKNIKMENDYICLNETECEGYIFNYICYNQCPDNTKFSNKTKNYCECLYKYHKIQKDNSDKKYIVCLDNDQPCPDDSKYIYENECVSECPNNYSKLKKIENNDIQCLNECDKNEFEYTDSENHIFCYDECPSNKQYHIFNDTVCIEKCDDETYFTDENSKICYKECPDNYYNTISEKNSKIVYGNCISECNNNYPYLFENTKSCLKNCSITKSYDFFSKIETYLNSENNMCISNCPNFLNKKTNECVEKCDENEFIDGKNCYEKCENISTSKYIYETKECVTECKDDYSYTFSDSDNICYKQCPENYYQDDDNKKCLNSCSESENNKFIKENTNKCIKCSSQENGYYISGNSNINQTCYEKCPNDYPYYKIDQNICYNNGCPVDTDINYYIQNENSYQCLNKCENYLFNNICYLNNCPDGTLINNENENICKCAYKYYEINKLSDKIIFYKCLDANEPCPQNYQYYSQKIGKCVSEKCNEYTRKINTTPINYECVDECENDEYILEYENDTIKLCVNQCPEEYQYHIKNKNNCLKKCDSNLYYTDYINKICYEKCPLLGLIDEKNDKKDKCISDNNCPTGYYLYETDNLCLSDCNITNTSKIVTNFETVLDRKTNKCVNPCNENRFIDYDTKECLENCDNSQYKAEKYCFNECKDNYPYIIEKTKKCTTNCQKEKYYSIISDNNTNIDYNCYEKCPDKYFQYDDNYECYSTCPNYYKNSTKKCVDNCNYPTDKNNLNDNEGFLIDKNSLNCLEKCTVDKPYNNKNNNICYASGDNNLYDYQIEDTTEFIQNCPENYYLFNYICYKNNCPENTKYDTTSSKCKCIYKYHQESKTNNESKIYDICLNQCPDNKNYETNNKCDTKCETGYTKIREINTNIFKCLQKCDDDEYEYKNKCLKSCPENTYHINKKKICYDDCSKSNTGDDYFTDENDHICYDVCSGLNTINEDLYIKNKCLSNEECPKSTPYLFKKTNTCLNNCNSTSKMNFFNYEITIENTILNECVSECENNQYKDHENNKCVEQCDENQFSYGLNCYNNCPINFSYYINNTRECLENCDNYYTISNNESNICYEKCPLISPKNNSVKLYQDDILLKCLTKDECILEKKYINENNQTCVNCTLNNGFIYNDNCVDICPDDMPSFNTKERICYKKNDEKLEQYNIENSYEYTNECPDFYYLFNYICYKSQCPSNTIYNTQNNICKCYDKFIISKDSKNRTIYDCIKNCPNEKKFFDLIEGCVEKCPNERNKISNNECLSDCPKLEYIYSEKLNDDIFYYCVEKCPENQKYHIEKEYDCLIECNNTKYYTDEDNNKCVSKCDDKILFNESDSENFGKCINGNCPTGYKLYSNNFCISSCNITKNYEIFNNKETYLYENNDIKQCVLNCYETTNKKYTDTVNKKCVEKCDDEMFLYKYNCYESCDNININYYLEDTKECVENCSNNNYYEIYNSNDKKCYKECPEKDDNNNKLYIKNNYCVKCNNKTEEKLINEGFIVPNDKICYDQCPSTLKNYNQNNNICKSGCSENPYIYENIITNECLINCPNDYKTFNYYCIKNCTEYNSLLTDDNNSCKCKYNFYIKQNELGNNIIICLENDNKNCANTSLYYDYETKECLTQCPQNKYQDNFDYICYKSCSESNQKYTKNKYCVNCTIPISLDDVQENEGFYIKNDENKNCYESCPDDYKYFDSDTNICKNTSCENPKPYRVENEFQCLSICPKNYYLFNNICYKEKCPSNTKEDIEKNCVCEFKYYKKDNLFICLDENELCPENKKYFNYTNECSETSCNNNEYNLMRIISSSDIINYKCVEECNETEFIYENSKGKFCRTDCPSDAPYYDFINKKCLIKCEYFTDISNKKCYDECPYYNIIDETIINKTLIKGQCLQSNKCDLDDYKYFFSNTKTCLTDCSITLTSEFLGKLNTYKFTDKENNIYKCITDCSSTTKKLTDMYYNECVNECGDNNGGEFLYENKCYKNCKEASKLTGKNITYYLSDSKECVSECPENYHTDFNNKICYDTCPLTDNNDNELFIYTLNNSCTTCNIGEGFYIKSKQQPNKCYNKCPNNYPYYDENNNICFSDSCLNTTNNPNPKMIYSLYTTNNSNEKKYICYSNCNDIITNWQGYYTVDYKCIEDTKCPNDYKYEYNKICYNDNCPDENMNTVTESNGNIKCYYNCPENKYIQNKECVETCNNNYPYKILATSTQYGICYTEKEKCPMENYFYYNIDEKICNNTCKYKSIELDSNYKPKNSTKGTCVLSCPDDYPYEYNNTCYNKCPENAPFKLENSKKCLVNCVEENLFEYKNELCIESCQTKKDDIYYYTINNRKICVNKCNNTQKFYIAETGQCLNECKIIKDEKTIYMHYNPDNFECINNCNELSNYQFSLYSENEAKPCLKECPSDKKNYYESNKTCLRDCDYFYTSDYKCVYYCDDDQYHLENNKKCLDACPNNYPFFLSKNTDNGKTENICYDSCPGNYYRLNSTNECVKSCNLKENYLLEGICYEKCPNPYNFYYTINSTKICQTSCSDTEKYKYHIKNDYECYEKCPNTYNYIYENNYICLDNCESEDHLQTKNGTLIICSNSCEEGKVLSEKQCKNECDTNRPYLEEVTRTCYKICPETSPYYLNKSDGKIYCVSNCGENKYISSDNKCVDECKKTENYIIDGNKCKSKCENENELLYYLYKKSNNNEYNIYKCVSNCVSDYQYRIYNSNECIKNCNENYPYLSPDNLCYEICNQNQKYPFSYEDNNNNNKKCLEKCPDNFKYYKKDYICVKYCNISNNNYILSNNECASSCNSTSDYIYLNYIDNNEIKCVDKCPSEKSFILPNNTCNSKCIDNYIYYNSEQKKCLSKCDEDYKADETIYGKECVSKCGDKFILNGNCVDNCTNGYDYYFESDKKCLTTCGDKYYAYNQKCLNNCPDEYPYYIYNKNLKMNICKESCSEIGYEFISVNNECISKCTSGSLYFINTTTNIQCYTQCPDNYYHYENKYECVNKCNEYIYYEKSLCIDGCLTDQNIYNDGEKKYCIDNCKNFNSTKLYNSQKGTCVSECDSSNYFILNETISTCICQNLYYFDEDNIMQCINPKINNCSENKIYNITIENTKKCTKTCNNILVDGNCKDECPSNTKLVTIDGIKTCVCKYNYYINEYNKKICLNQNDNCPIKYPYLISSANQCVNKCTGEYLYYYQNNCVIKCPTNYISDSENICQCNKSIKKWYIINETNETKCAQDNCPTSPNKTYFVNDTHECVSQCSSEYYIFEKGCYQNGCPEFSESENLSKICKFIEMKNVSNITDIINRLTPENVIRFYELYKNNESVYNYSNFNVSVEISDYEKYKNKNDLLKSNSNLSNIDLSGCINDIYSANNLDKNDKLILIKYDLISDNSSDLVINPVQYQLYSYEKKEQISIKCSTKILISFPLSDKILNNKKRRLSENNIPNINNDVISLFEYAKKLNNDSNNKTDIFNPSDSLYSDLCEQCVYNKTDVVLKDRIKYIYPNFTYYPNDCEYAYTDYEKVRFNAYCEINNNNLLKDRSYTKTNKFDSNKINNLQGPSNFAVLGCNDNFQVKNNGAFIYGIIILILDFILFILAITLGIKIIKDKINKNKKLKEKKENNESSNPPKKDKKNDNNNMNVNIKITLPKFENKFTLPKDSEYIPKEYNNLFFNINECGHVKEIKRGQLPFKISKNTKFLYDKNTANTDKKNILKIVENEDIDINDINNISIHIEQDKKEFTNIYKLENNESSEYAPENTQSIKDNKSNKKIYAFAEIKNQNNENNDNSSNNNKSNEIEHSNRALFNNDNDDENKLRSKKNQDYDNKKNKNKKNVENDNQSELNSINNTKTKTKNKNNNSEYNEDSNNYRKKNYKNSQIKKKNSSPRSSSKSNSIDYDNNSLYQRMIRLERYKEYSYEKALSRENENICVYFLTFIFDKIYIFKIFLFPKEYDNIFAQISLYLLYHILFLSFITAFFDIETLSKIFIRSGEYPNFGYQILIGFISLVLSFIIYRILLLLIRNNKRIEKYINNSGTNSKYNKYRDSQKDKNTDINNVICCIRIKLIIYGLLMLGICLFCFFYLCLFCSVFVASKIRIFNSYGYGLLEMLVIKIVYAIILASLRKCSLSCESKCFYNFIQFFDIFLS